MSKIQSFFTEDIPGAFSARVESLKDALEEAEEAGNDEKADKLQQKVDALEEAEATFRVEITGDGGGAFYFNYFDGNLEVSDSAEEDPIAWVTQSAEDFTKLQDAGVNPLGSGGGGGSGKGGLGPLNPGLADKVRELDTIMKVVLADLPDGAGEGALVVRLGEGTDGDPQVTITVSHPDYLEMLSGRLLPPQAFMMGKIKIEGDMSIVMRLAALGMG